MMHWFPRGVLLAVFLSALALGCRGEENDLGPLLEFDRGTPAPRIPYSLELGRYADPGSRLEFVTPVVEPTAVPTRRPTPDFAQMVRPTVVVPTPAPSVMDLGADSCEGYFRLMLVGYEGKRVFGPALMLALSNRLLEERPDCLEAGWAPSFGIGQVCLGDSVAGVDMPHGLLSFGRYDRKGKARLTMRDQSGNILVHFDRMPLRDAQGCWFYDGPRMSWAWFIRGQVSGVDVPGFPGCEDPLRVQLGNVAGGGVVSVLDIARLIDGLRHDVPGCGDALWNPYPVRLPHEDCAVQSDLGITQEGLLVVHWNLDHLPSDQAVCWYVEPVSGIWGKSHVRPDDGRVPLSQDDVDVFDDPFGPVPVIPDDSGG